MDNRKRNIAVVYGGYSSEWEISVQSGKSVAGWLRGAGMNVYETVISKDRWEVLCPNGKEEARRYPVNKDDFSFTMEDGRHVRPDKAYIVIHGDPGENGRLQAYFELIGMPYVGCTSLCTAIAFDKYACKTYLRDSGISMAPDLMLRKGDRYDPKETVSALGLPVFVKPTGGGSSFGVTKVKREEDLNAALDAAFAESDTVIIETAITGREIDCGVYDDKTGVHALPLIQIVPRNEFFDYEAKYLGASKEICPAPVTESERELIQTEAVKIFRRLGCNGLVRMDFILGDDGKAYFLELNPNPGMTAASLVPQMVRQAGMTMEDFLKELIDRD